MSNASLDKLAAAIEKIEKRLADIESKLNAESSSSSGSSGATSAAWEAFVGQHIPQLLSSAKTIGPEVSAHAELFAKAVNLEGQLIAKASTTKKPADTSSYLGDLSAAINEVGEYERKQKKPEFPNHLKALANGVGALGWVAITPTPAPYAKEQGETAFMWTNRILTGFKGQDAHIQFAKSLVDFLNELVVHIKQNHTTGLTWA